MAARANSYVQVQKNFDGFIAILTSAACEWFLIILLLIDGLLSYLLTKFAGYCNLQKPCIFCCRFEHVIGNARPQLYEDLLCSNHISELSSWLACQIYGKDGNGVSVDCSLSSTKKEGPDPKEHILVGKSELDLGSSRSKRSTQNRNVVHSSVGAKPCSLCNRPFKPRENAQGLRRKPAIDKPNIPLPHYSIRSRVHRRDGSKKTRDKVSASVTPSRPGKNGWDLLPQEGYNELKFSSDTDTTGRHGKHGWGPLPNGGYKIGLKFSSDTDSKWCTGKHGRAPLPHVRYNELKFGSDTDSNCRPGKHGWDPLPHVGYNELKYSSDTDTKHCHGKHGQNQVPHVGYKGLKFSSDNDSNWGAGKHGRVPFPHVGYKGLKLGSDHHSNRRSGKHVRRPFPHVGSKGLKFSSDTDSNRLTGKHGRNPLPHSGYEGLKFSSDTDSNRRPGKFGWDPLSNVAYTKLKMSSDTESTRCTQKIGWDPLSHVGYTDVKFDFDYDSEFQFSDDDGVVSLISGTFESENEGLVVQCAPDDPFKAQPNSLDPAMPSFVSREDKPFLSNPFVQPDGSGSDVKLLDFDFAFENGLGESNWQQTNRNSNPSALPELISLVDILPSSNVAEKMFFADFTETSDFEHASISKNDETLKSVIATDGASAKPDPIVNDPAVMEPNHIGVNDVSKSAATGKEGDACVIFKEQSTVKKPDRLDGDLNSLDSQNPSAQESNLKPPHNTVSGVKGVGDEKQVTDASNSNPKAVLYTSVSTDSGLEALDEGYASEIEGESIVDQLKRQVDYYRNSIKELFKELDEERNASEIAANQAMAMITKLQEEKAAIHMEALQYLRMMEEQAEFDVEALEKANDLLAEKEKEIQDLEAELEFLQLDVPKELTMEKIPENLKAEIDTLVSTVAPGVKNEVQVSSNSSRAVPNVEDDSGATTKSVAVEVPKASNDRLFSETTLLEFEDEKLYISNCLKSLERKLSEISCNGASSNMPNGGLNQGETPRKEKILLKGIEENVVPGKNDLHISNGTAAAQEESVHAHSLDGEEKDDSGFPGQKDFTDHSENDLVILENEISDLNDRLEALETDHDFLEHMLYSLQNGNEGLRFVQEIAQQLRELRKIGSALRSQTVM